jgi:hypothetical protein
MASCPSQWRAGFQEVRLVTLDKGANLRVDRIFIRQGSEDYNSVSFRGDVSHMGVIHKVRFWAKLSDVNKIKCKVIN